MALASSNLVFHLFRFNISVYVLPQKDSMTALP
jgi:hypothetical protein